MSFSNKKLGMFIRNGRLDKELTQEQLAEKLDCNLSNDTYQQLLRILNQCTRKEQQILLENANTLIENRDEKPI